ncbi:MAG: allophanate hydrolase [Rhodobacteraceae bacterium]|nr:allophanate hydrolase [Paracoccaceae bacterium]
MSDLSDLSFDFVSLRAAYARGIRPVEVVEEVYRRIAIWGDPGIFLHLRPKAEVLAEAGALDGSGALHGLPFAIKDNIDLAGAPTTAACPDFAYVADADATAVTRLRDAGALVIGKTNLDQFATGLVGVRSPFPPPKNALDPDLVPGGSSSGSAVAVSAGLVSFALGTDTAGSGRVPAALNGIVGLKPTLGAMPATGVVPACRTLDTLSVFALTVPDAHEVFAAAAGPDLSDPQSRDIPVPPLAAPPDSLRIGIPDALSIEFFGDDLQRDAFGATCARLEAMDHDLVPLDFAPFYEVAALLYEGAWVAERMVVIEDLLRDRPDSVLPVIRQIVGAADGLSAADAFRGIYRLAELKRCTGPLLAGVDLLCVPTIPTVYSVEDLEADPIGPNARLGTYTNFVNLLDLCGIAVPLAPRDDGRPGSVTLLAEAGRDSLTSGLGDALQRDAGAPLGATGASLPDAPTPPPGPAAHETVLAAVGAHMSGLPLNGQLTERGARFLEATKTAPEYRLYALQGGPPHRPGLLAMPGGGGKIAVELWAMPIARLGDFLTAIPAPLGLGTVRLADGRAVTGFLVESAGVAGAEDITALGGWRAYLDRLTAAVPVPS